MTGPNTPLPPASGPNSTPRNAFAGAPGEIERFFLLIGTMKSGTTTLFKHLRQHPEISGSREKEPNFFTRRENRERGRSWYEGLWDFDPARHRWAMEASTDYTKLPSMPSGAYFMARFGAEFRFLYVVRDPIERIVSHYRHGMGQGWIEQPIAEHLLPTVVSVCNYHMQLWPYVHAFERESILVVHQSELAQDLDGVLRRACGFLGVDSGFVFQPMPRQNVSHAFDRRAIARLLDERGALPDLVSPDRLADLGQAEFEELARGWCREAGQPAAYAECVRAYERAVQPTAAQAAEVRALLADDLDRFRDDWGIDPWSPENRAAIEAERRSSAAA